jgi:hypothetical protein
VQSKTVTDSAWVFLEWLSAAHQDGYRADQEVLCFQSTVPLPSIPLLMVFLPHLVTLTHSGLSLNIMKTHGINYTPLAEEGQGIKAASTQTLEKVEFLRCFPWLIRHNA